MRGDIIYEDDKGRASFVSTVQEGGPNWAGGTVIDVLNEHLSGERKCQRIVVFPDATEPAAIDFGDSKS